MSRVPHPHPRRTVVFLDHCAKMSGAELALLRTVAHLRRHTPLVILGEDGPLAGALTAQGTRVLVEPLPGSARDFDRRAVGATWGAARRAAEVAAHARRLRRLIGTEAPVLVHTNSMKAHVYGALALAGTGVPQVAHVRDRVTTDFMSAGGVRLMRTVLGSRPLGLVSNSRSTEQSLPAARGRQRRIVLPSPIDAPPPVPDPDGTTRDGTTRDGTTGDGSTGDGTVTFGIVGRLAQWKGQHLAISAFADACRRTGRAHRLLVVGGDLFGEAAYARSLHELAAGEGVAGRVEFLGHVDDVYAAMSRMDVLVHASVIPEPFGQVIVQGMAMGLPVVASGEGGPAEVVTDGSDGLLFVPRDAAALTARMVELAGSPALRRDLGAAARKEASQYFAGTVTERLESFYDGLVQHPEPAS